MDSKSKLNKLILKSSYVTIIVLIIAIIALLILKYDVEGEKNMPFKLSSIIVISSAEGYQEKENPEYMWDAEIHQTNDIYLSIEKNKNYKETEIIKSIEIENIKVDKEPLVGELKFYRISKSETDLFDYKEELEIKDNVEYIGDLKTDLSNLKISNQGGTIIIRVINKIGKSYKSNDKQLEHNGQLLNKIGVSYEEVKSKISFELIINLESDISFKAQVNINLPVGDIIKEGTSNIEIKDIEKIVFKRQ